MRDKAELTDKADQLEHLVVQLQGETDTIGKGETDAVGKRGEMLWLKSIHAYRYGCTVFVRENHQNQ